jgi:hypothetical protein
VFTASDTQCATSADCAARGPAFAGAVCVENACVAPDAGGLRDGGPEAATHLDASDGSPPVDAGSSGPDWTCLGHVTYPDASAGTATLTVPYGDLIAHQPLAGIRVRACYLLDTACANPASGGGLTDDAGRIALDVPSGFGGFVLSTWDAGLSALTYLNPPVFAPRTDALQVMVTPDDVSALSTALGKVNDAAVVVQPGLGLFFLAAYDCQGKQAAGVQFSLDTPAPGSLTVYSHGGGLDTAATATDGVAGGAIINVPIGPVGVTGTIASTNTKIASVSGQSQGGAVTFLNIMPAP